MIIPIAGSFIHLWRSFFKLCKLVYFNAVLTIVILAARYFLLLEQGEIVVLSLYGMGNATFVLFDILLSKLITLYIRRFRAKLKIGRFLK